MLESRARAGSLRDPVSGPDGNAPARSARLIARTAMRRESPALREVSFAETPGWPPTTAA